MCPVRGARGPSGWDPNRPTKPRTLGLFLRLASVAGNPFQKVAPRLGERRYDRLTPLPRQALRPGGSPSGLRQRFCSRQQHRFHSSGLGIADWVANPPPPAHAHHGQPEATPRGKKTTIFCEKQQVLWRIFSSGV